MGLKTYLPALTVQINNNSTKQWDPFFI